MARRAYQLTLREVSPCLPPVCSEPCARAAARSTKRPGPGEPCVSRGRGQRVFSSRSSSAGGPGCRCGPSTSATSSSTTATSCGSASAPRGRSAPRRRRLEPRLSSPHAVTCLLHTHPAEPPDLASAPLPTIMPCVRAASQRAHFVGGWAPDTTPLLSCSPPLHRTVLPPLPPSRPGAVQHFAAQAGLERQGGPSASRPSPAPSVYKRDLPRCCSGPSSPQASCPCCLDTKSCVALVPCGARGPTPWPPASSEPLAPRPHRPRPCPRPPRLALVPCGAAHAVCRVLVGLRSVEAA